MTIESAVAALTASTTALTTAVGTQQLAVTAAVGNFTATTNRVNALNNVNNTADADKPVSTATVTAIALKQATLVSGINISTVNGQSLLGGSPLIIERSATSLNRVTYDNRATLRALSPQLDDSTMIESLGLFMWINTKLEPEDDETCFNTANGQWLLRVPAWDLLDAWDLHEQSITDDLREDESLRFAAYILANK
jgi:hypothetical protein